MKTILVSGASGIVGYGILRSLKRAALSVKLIGTTIYDDSAAPGFCDVFELAPRSNDAGYMEWLTDTIKKHRVDLVVPSIEIDMYAWVQHADAIRAAGAVPLLNNPELIHLCQDKWLFFESLWADGLECAIDTTLEADFETLQAKYGLPFMLKPRHGFGSKGIVRVDRAETFVRHQASIGAILMAQPIVGHDDEEYTTSAFCDGQGGFYGCMTLRRRLSRDGFTEKAEVVSSDEFIETLSALCSRFKPIGPTNFQFRKCTEGIKLLEINPRISSSTSIRAAFGYNESVMAVEYFLDRKAPSQPKIRRGKAVRYTEDCIFYEDSLYL